MKKKNAGDDEAENASQENRFSDKESSCKDDPDHSSDASSRFETATQNDSEEESEYKTVNEDWDEDYGEQGQRKAAKASANGLTEIWDVSSFVQKLLYEDSKAGDVVVNLFAAVKSMKNSIDNLINLNYTVQEKLRSLSHDTWFIQMGYGNLFRTMAFFFERVNADSSIRNLESEAVNTPTVKSISQPEINFIKKKSATEIGRFCSSCGFVKYLRENVICPLCEGEIIVREKCSDCIAERSLGKKGESCRLSICEYCGLPELRNKETESNILDEIKIRKPTGSEENLQKTCEKVETLSQEQPKPSSPRSSSTDSTPSQTSSKVVENFFEMLKSHVFKSEEGSRSTIATRESLLSALLTSKSGTVMSHEDSKKISEGTTTLSDSTVQMICEICGILGVIGPQGHPPGVLESTSSTASNKTPKIDEMDSDQGDNSHPVEKAKKHQLPTVSERRTNKKRKNSVITIYLPKSQTAVHEVIKPEQPNEEQTGSRETSQPEPPESDEEVFEEALSEPYPGLPSLPAGHRANCMGDLNKEVTKVSKSVSTLTATNDFVSSWIGKIAEDIKTKIRNLKPRSRQVSVTDEGTSDRSSKKLPAVLEFTISTNTPVGVFDVTIRQYRDTRRKLNGSFRDVISEGDKLVPVEMKTLRDGVRYWSEESLILSDSDHVVLASGSGAFPQHTTPHYSSAFLLEEEMEEFIEVYVRSRNKTLSTSGFVSKREKGFIVGMRLLHVRPPFMEMVRRQPKSFVQEVIPKTERFILRKDDRQEEKEVKEEEFVPEVQVDAGSMLLPRKGSGGKRNDEDQNSQGSADSPNSSDIMSRSFNDLVISIQIDVDDEEEEEEGSRTNNQIYIDLKVGGQEGQKNFKGKECVYRISKGEVERLAEDVEDSGREVEKGRITFNETPIMIDREDEDDQQEEVESKTLESTESVDSETKRIMRRKSVAFCDEFSEEEVKGVILDPDLEVEPKAKRWATAYTVFPIVKANQAEVRYLQNKRLNALTLDRRTPTLSFFLTRTDNEIHKALDLIKEIETKVIKVKLSEAIKILPVLESELRKHLREKMKGIAGRRSPSRETSVDNYFSALEVRSSEEVIESSQSSEERFQYLLKLLSDLEEAVKSNVCSKEQICKHSSSRIYNLLHALTNNIRGLEDDTTMSQISETVDIASQLDTAVREFDHIVKKPTDYMDELIESRPEDKVKDEPSVKDHLTNVRKRVFEMVKEDAFETEERIEMDFDRIDRLERENEESMKFVEAFLEKTLRRSAELTNLKTELTNLSSVLGDMYQELSKATQQKKRSIRRSSSPPTKEVPVRNTVSGLLLALDKLKTRARMKNEACKKILGTIASVTSNQRLNLDRKSLRSSKSTYRTKSAEDLVSSVREFKKIGQTSLYLSWSKPEGILSDSVVGYEILVNGKLNQKVRNPERLQAVLYSVDLSLPAEVQLLGLIENGSKVLLAIVTYLDL